MHVDIAAAEGAEGGYVDDPAQHAVSRSYEWLLAVINHLCGNQGCDLKLSRRKDYLVLFCKYYVVAGEVWKLLKAENEEPEPRPTSVPASKAPFGGAFNAAAGATAASSAPAEEGKIKNPSYSRADVCEVSR